MSDSSEDKMLSLYPIDYPFETLVSRINADLYHVLRHN